MKKSNLFCLLVSLIVFSCASSSNESSSETEEQVETKENATQLTYRDLIRIVFDDEGEGIEWHGEESKNDLVDLLAITTGEPCGEGDCGERLYLINTGNQTINTVVKGDFDVEGTQSYITRKYIIEAGDTLNIGCSHLCSDGESYEFPRSIVATKYEEVE